MYGFWPPKPTPDVPVAVVAQTHHDRRWECKECGAVVIVWYQPGEPLDPPAGWTFRPKVMRTRAGPITTKETICSRHTP